MPSPIRAHQPFGQLAAALALLSFGCVTGQTAHAPPDGGGGGSAGSGAAGSTGAAGQTGAGGGGRGGSTATGGAGGTIVGTGAGGGGAGGSVQPGLPLPLIVTDVYNNQGWFGDGAVAAFFASGSMVIRQAQSTAGPCAARAAGARGACLQVTYTPPAGLVQPDGGTGGTFVGVFFLTTLTMAHPELTPPAFVGDANWGAEPGKTIAPGATKISFLAAAATAGQTVSFKAGVATDPFSLPEQIETLTTTWMPYELSLAGITYPTPVLGAFAWVLHDTSQPATFYLDGIVWE